MTEHKPTPEQQAILDRYTETDDPLLISALAGAAKTTTLTMLAAAQPSKTVLAIAFNKHIANELGERMPSNTTCKTMNALGHRMLGDFLGRRVNINAQKRGDILKAFIDQQSQGDKEILYENLRDLRDTIASACNHGYLGRKPFSGAKPLYSEESFYAMIGIEFSDIELEAIEHTIREGIVEALRGNADFSDQILIPACWPAAFSPYAVTLIDEAQDLSAVQHVLLRKIVGKKSRLIAVGDSAQAIYGFRGADEHSMSSLRDIFGLKDMLLSVSFRLPRSVADHVRWRAPHIQSPEWAIDGSVEYLPEWSPDTIPDDSAIICRNNAPLLRTTFALLRAGRRPKLPGNDVIKGLVRELKKLSKDLTLPSEDVVLLVDEWEKEKRKRYKDSNIIIDKAACMRMFATETDTLGLAIAKAEQISNLEGPITLCTGHKSKGLEWDDVFFLDEHLISREEDAGQELNLRYVIATRAKRRLAYIKSEDRA